MTQNKSFKSLLIKGLRLFYCLLFDTKQKIILFYAHVLKLTNKRKAIMKARYNSSVKTPAGWRHVEIEADVMKISEKRVEIIS